jgi:hypothetical protein
MFARRDHSFTATSPPTTFRCRHTDNDTAYHQSSLVSSITSPKHDWTWRCVSRVALLAPAANEPQAAVEEKVRTNDSTNAPRGYDTDARAVLLPPINFIFKLLQSRATISVWLYENLGMRIEGKLRVRILHLQHQGRNKRLTRRRALMSS